MGYCIICNRRVNRCYSHSLSTVHKRNLINKFKMIKKLSIKKYSGYRYDDETKSLYNDYKNGLKNKSI